MFEQPKTKIQIGALFGCISDSLQPLAVHSHQLLCVQPNDSGKRNTAKSCTEYSQYICSAGYHLVSGGQEVTPEPRFRGFVLNHQVLKPKIHPKTAVFDQSWLF